MENTKITEFQDKKGQSSIWLDGIMGVVVGDALGCPVEFRTRGELKSDPVTGMRGHGTFDLPAGSWTDDSSLSLATLASIIEWKKLNLPDVMHRFAIWLARGGYTPYGYAFDVGKGTLDSIIRYMKVNHRDINTCGGASEQDNGNGSLMRIMPACLYLYRKYHLTGNDQTAIWTIHKVSGLTHNHLRSKIACTMYYFMACQILDNRAEDKEKVSLSELLQKGIHEAIDSELIGSREEETEYGLHNEDNQLASNPVRREIQKYRRLADLESFAKLDEGQIRSFGYVIDSLEAAVWCLLNTCSYRDCELKAVNLGYDTDTVAAIAGGLAGLYYGYGSIPNDWLKVISRRGWIEELCRKAEEV